MLSATNGAAQSLRGLAIDPGDLRGLPSLPGSLSELTAMRAAFADEPALFLTGAQATEPQVRSAPLGDYRVLAFATHGLVGGQIAQLSEPALMLLSHWPVRDDATAFLSVETLRRAEAGAGRAEALPAAQLEMVRGQTGMAGETSPAVWAPFVLIEG